MSMCRSALLTFAYVKYAKVNIGRPPGIGGHTTVFLRATCCSAGPSASRPFRLASAAPRGAGRQVTHRGCTRCYPFNYSGQPAISVPAGFTASGLPVGLQIVGRRLEDALVLRAAAAFEMLRPWAARRPRET